MSERPHLIGVTGFGLGRALRGGGQIVAVIVLAGVFTYLLAGRGGSPPGSAASPAPAAIAAAPSAGAAAGTAPSNPRSDPASPAAPSASPSPELNASPTATPERAPVATPDPTLDPTPTPTKRPATPKPTHDPAPEPTPIVYKASGGFGQTLSAGGVTASLARHAPSSDPHCASGEPSLQGHTEILTFELRITWSKPSEAMEPFVAVGASPYFNVQWFDPSGFESGRTYVWSTCVRPGDTDRAIISFESNGGAPRSWRFTFQ